MTKSGSLDYAIEICKKTPFTQNFLFTKNANTPFSVKGQKITTYDHGYGSFLINTFLFLFKCPFLLKRYKKDEQISHLYFTVFHPWNLIISFWAKRYRLKTILTVHDYKTHLGERSLLVEIIQKLNIRRADHVIFLSEAERQKAIPDIEILSVKSSVIGHPLLPVSKVNLVNHSDNLKVLFLGRIKEYKGIIDLIDVCSKLKMELTIAGEGQCPSIVSGEEIHLINKYLTIQEIEDLLITHHVLILPYNDASQSGVLSLGISAGIPMIIRRVGGLTEQLDNESAIWIEDNELALEQALLKIQNSKDVYELIKAKLISYKNRYDKDWQMQYEKVIKNILVQH